ncbi:MAG TPA: hypothetical protein ENI23_14030 [bacterium]|nr:hypothetical protein [bacterium]
MKVNETKKYEINLPTSALRVTWERGEDWIKIYYGTDDRQIDIHKKQISTLIEALTLLNKIVR